MEDKDSGFREAKVIEVTRRGDQVSVVVVEEEFSAMSVHQRSEAVVSLIRATATHLEQQADLLADREATTTPVNDGSLYDDVVFSVAMYLNTRDEMNVKAAFGAQADQSVTPAENVRMLSATLMAVADQAEAQNKSQREASAASANVRGANRF